MPDDTSKTRPQDAKRINVHEEYELQHWSQKFGCSQEELKKAVEKVGTSAEKVEAHVKGKHRSSGK